MAHATLLALALVLLGGCSSSEAPKPEPPTRPDSDDGDGSDDGGSSSSCSTSDRSDCYDNGCLDAYEGYSPDASYWGCAGDCRDFYCDAYCECELYYYGDYFECGYC